MTLTKVFYDSDSVNNNKDLTNDTNDTNDTVSDGDKLFYTFDSEAKSSYLYINADEKIAATKKCLSGAVLVDVGISGEIVGIEIVNTSLPAFGEKFVYKFFEKFYIKDKHKKNVADFLTKKFT